MLGGDPGRVVAFYSRNESKLRLTHPVMQVMVVLTDVSNLTPKGFCIYDPS